MASAARLGPLRSRGVLHFPPLLDQVDLALKDCVKLVEEMDVDGDPDDLRPRSSSTSTTTASASSTPLLQRLPRRQRHRRLLRVPLDLPRQDRVSCVPSRHRQPRPRGTVPRLVACRLHLAPGRLSICGNWKRRKGRGRTNAESSSRHPREVVQGQWTTEGRWAKKGKPLGRLRMVRLPSPRRGPDILRVCEKKSNVHCGCVMVRV